MQIISKTLSLAIAALALVSGVIAAPVAEASSETFGELSARATTHTGQATHCKPRIASLATLVLISVVLDLSDSPSVGVGACGNQNVCFSLFGHLQYCGIILNFGHSKTASGWRRLALAFTRK